MPQVQIPDFVGQNQEYERLRQNAMVNLSNLRTAKLQQQRLGMENQEAQRQTQKRTELEQLLLRTPEADRDRAGLEWAKVNNQDLYGRLTVMHLQKLQQSLPLNPQGALQNFERATGERLEYDPTSGVALTTLTDGSMLAISPKGTQHIPVKQDLATRAAEAEQIAAAQTRGRVKETPLPPVRPDNSLTPTELFNKDPQQYEAMEEAKARAGAKYRRLEGGTSASQDLQKKRLLMTIKSKKDRALAALEREYRSPVAFGRFEPMNDEELQARKQQVQDDFENDLTAAGFEAEPFSYSGQLRPSRSLTAAPKTGGITREQAVQELRRRGVIR